MAALPAEEDGSQPMGLVDFDVLESIGAGSFSTVYKARPAIVGTLPGVVVLKETKGLSSSPLTQANVAKEVEMLRRSRSCPYVSHYFTSFVENDRHYMVIEYVPGGDLLRTVQQCMSHKNPLNEGTLWRYLFELGQAVAFLHKVGIVHRDIKCQNIMITAHGTLKLIDLGLACTLAPGELLSERCGTPFYMAAELIRKEQYDHRVDVWSAGCVFYMLAQLRPAFNGTNLHSLCGSILNDHPPPLASRYSPHLSALILQMLDKRRDNRPTMDAILRHPVFTYYPTFPPHAFMLRPTTPPSMCPDPSTFFASLASGLSSMTYGGDGVCAPLMGDPEASDEELLFGDGSPILPELALQDPVAFFDGDLGFGDEEEEYDGGQGQTEVEPRKQEREEDRCVPGGAGVFGAVPGGGIASPYSGTVYGGGEVMASKTDATVGTTVSTLRGESPAEHVSSVDDRLLLLRRAGMVLAWNEAQKQQQQQLHLPTHLLYHHLHHHLLLQQQAQHLNQQHGQPGFPSSAPAQLPSPLQLAAMILHNPQTPPPPPLSEETRSTLTPPRISVPPPRLRELSMSTTGTGGSSPSVKRSLAELAPDECDDDQRVYGEVEGGGSKGGNGGGFAATGAGSLRSLLGSASVGRLALGSSSLVCSSMGGSRGPGDGSKRTRLTPSSSPVPPPPIIMQSPAHRFVDKHSIRASRSCNSSPSPLARHRPAHGHSHLNNSIRSRRVMTPPTVWTEQSRPPARISDLTAAMPVARRGGMFCCADASIGNSGSGSGSGHAIAGGESPVSVQMQESVFSMMSTATAAPEQQQQHQQYSHAGGVVMAPEGLCFAMGTFNHASNIKQQACQTPTRQQRSQHQFAHHHHRQHQQQQHQDLA